MTLQATLDSLREASRSKLPSATVQIMTTATRAVQDSGLAERALTTGQVAPDFSLADWRGRIWSAAELLRRGPLVMTFFRGSW